MRHEMIRVVRPVASWAGLGAILAFAVAPIAAAQSIPLENFTVKTGPNQVFHMHYADNLCPLAKLPKGVALPPSVSRTFSLAQGGRTVAEIYTIYEPDVRHAATLYTTIPLNAGDRMLLYACGCVQTGGKGLTWKSYFDPKGGDSNHLYSGTFGLMYTNEKPPPGFWQHPTGLRRIKDFVTHQGPGLTIPAGRSARVILGYEDDGYSDNGYTAHDDGTGGQCQGVGPAAVDVVIYHFGAN